MRPITEHALQRARERYGLDLVPGDLAEIAWLVQNNHGIFLGYTPDGTKTIWSVPFRAGHVKVILSTCFYFVETFLPANESCRIGAGARERNAYRKGERVYG